MWYYQLSNKEVNELAAGERIELKLSPQRTLTIGMDSLVDLKERAIREDAEAKIAKLRGE